MIAALIVAAGKGTRMGASMPKQFLCLGGVPILAHTLNSFDACQRIDRIIVVVPPDEIDHCRQHILGQTFAQVDMVLMAGGGRRQDSVRNGLAVLGEEGVVLIHDGVRPFVSVDLIERCIDGAERWGACIPAVEVTDTLKRVNAQGIIEGTVPRAALVMAQTPQAFRLSLIKSAHRMAEQHHWQVTDDASLIEQMGGSVHVIQGSPNNIKITTPEDLQRAEMLLGQGAALHR